MEEVPLYNSKKRGNRMKANSSSIKKLVIALIGLIFLVCLTGFLLAYIPTQMSEKHTNDIIELYFHDVGYSSDSFSTARNDNLESYTLTSDAGYTIPVYYICPNGAYENKTMIFVHWHESNHIAMYPLAELFLERGWNVVLYDQRAHGKNTAPTVTFGYIESADLKQVVDFVWDKSNGATIGALGQSMGAATVAYYSGTEHAKQSLDYAILDSAFSGMYDEIYWEISKTKFPLPAKALTSLGSIFCKLIYGFSFSDVDIVKQIKNNSIPTLVMHSKADQKCPYYMSENLFNAIPHDSKKFITYEDSEHLFSFWDEQDRYINELLLFIEAYNNK
jgi:uncharacterized protein